MADILVLYYSAGGSVRELARQIARGIESVPGTQARIRTVPRVSPVTETAAPPVPDEGAPYVEKHDLAECAALALGSPTRFGNMAAPVKHFIDTLGAEWGKGTLAGKPASVFTSTGSMHGGQESTLLTMMVPLLHHGMLIVGVPFTETRLSATQTGGSPYGATHWGGAANDKPFSEDEKALAFAQGKRLAEVTAKLARP